MLMRNKASRSKNIDMVNENPKASEHYIIGEKKSTYRRRRTRGPEFAESRGRGIHGLSQEFRRFTLNSVQLRRLYSETLKALDDISSNGVIPQG
jgi:hypothetical protein